MSFLGLTNFCRSWMSYYSELAAPLMPLVYETHMAASDKIEWTIKAEKAFLKHELVGSAVLGLLDYSKPFVELLTVKTAL